MWKDLWSILSRGETLLDEALHETDAMFDRAREMFNLVVEAMVEEVHDDLRDRIARMDQVLNEEQITVRKKVFEHLATSHGRDLLQGLILTSVVIDLERIGDYTKNIGELVSLIPGRLDFGEYEERYESVVARTRTLFDRTREAFSAWDCDAAREHASFFHEISQEVDGTLNELLESGSPGESIEKRVLGLALLLRYHKRVGAHLKNICTAVSNPFPDIGFRPKRRNEN
jgi:phosphate uptake regulator